MRRTRQTITSDEIARRPVQGAAVLVLVLDDAVAPRGA